MEDLSTKKCVACEGGMPPLTLEQAQILARQLKSDWVIEEKKIWKPFVFKNFKEALGFVNRVGELAEDEGHHPDINLHDYKKVVVTLSTHAIGGLSENDFIVARKIDLF